MRATLAILIVVTLTAGLVAYGAAQLEGEAQGDGESVSRDGGPTEEPTRTSTKGELFTENMSREGSLETGGDRQDSEWKETWVKASILGVHFNLNQPAKTADSSADNWSLVFHLDAPWRAEDRLYFCGPEPEFTVKIWDGETDGLVYDDKVPEVPPCRN